MDIKVEYFKFLKKHPININYDFTNTLYRNKDILSWLNLNNNPSPICILDSKVIDSMIYVDIKFKKEIYKNCDLFSIVSREWYFYVKAYLEYKYNDNTSLITLNLNRFSYVEEYKSILKREEIPNLEDIEFKRKYDILRIANLEETPELYALYLLLHKEFKLKLKNLIKTKERFKFEIWNYISKISYKNQIPHYEFDIKSINLKYPDFELTDDFSKFLDLETPKHALVILLILHDSFRVSERLISPFYRTLYDFYANLSEGLDKIISIINGKSTYLSNFSSNYILKEKVQEFKKDNKLLNDEFVEEFSVSNDITSDDTFVKYKYVNSNIRNFVLSYNQLISLLNKEDVELFLKNLSKSKKCAKEMSNVSVIN